jgi:dTDP-4-amino-4,6-dideoxygalactose transaminase
MLSSAAVISRRIFLSAPHIGGSELSYVQQTFASNWLSTVGPNLDALERDFAALTGHSAVALSSGTSALHLAIKLLGLKDGDEVITPTLTFAASCNPILYERAVPVFMDSDSTSWTLDPNILADFLKHRAKENRLPKAVIVVHLFGQAADLDSILECCRQYDLPLIEDAANALGTLYKGKQVGSFGAIGTFSLGGNKIITASAGGILISHRPEWVEKARFWSTQSRDDDPDQTNNYLHSELGYNYRMSNVLAAIARGQLELLEDRVEKRRAIFDRYAASLRGLPGIEPQPERSFGCEIDRSRHNRWLSCFLIDSKLFGLSPAQLIRHLNEANIESRPVWKPMHTQKLYAQYECVGGAVAERLHSDGICLPSSSFLTGRDQQFVIDAISNRHRSAQSARACALNA